MPVSAIWPQRLLQILVEMLLLPRIIFIVYRSFDTQLACVKAAGFDTYMVQIGGFYKIQVGAYREKANADNMMAKLKTAGIDAFITTESGASVSTLKSMDEIAREVIRGDWGNGA